MSNEAQMPLPQVKCPNPKCGQQRSAADRYCGECGSTLQPDVQQLVKWAMDEQTKDREVFQIETAKAIAEKVWDWGKLFLGIAGVSTALFVLALAVVGYKSIADIDRSRTESQAASAKAKAEAEKAATDAKNSVKELKTDLQITLTAIETKRKEVIAQFEKEKGEVDEVGKKLPSLIKRIDGVTARLDKAEPKLIKLDKKVDVLEDQFVGKPLPPAVSDRLNRKLAPFRKYLEALGFRDTADDVPFYYGGMGSDANIFYLATPPKIAIGSYFLSDERFLDAPDAMAREFAHHILFGSPGNEWKASEGMIGFESGYADYYVASWANNPSIYRAVAAVLKKRVGFDKDEIRNLKNDRSLKDLSKESIPQIAGEIWGGLFWELRVQLGQSVADKLLTNIWKSISPKDVKEDPLAMAKWLRDKLVELATPLDGGKQVGTIRKVFERRGLDP